MALSVGQISGQLLRGIEKILDSYSSKSRFISFLLAAALVGFLSAVALVSVAYAEEGVTPEAETTSGTTVCQAEPDPEPSDLASPSETPLSSETESTEPEDTQTNSAADCEPPTVAEEPIEEPADAGELPDDQAAEAGTSEESDASEAVDDPAASSVEGDATMEDPPKSVAEAGSADGTDAEEADTAAEGAYAEELPPDGESELATADDEPAVFAADPNFVRGGDTYTFLSSAGDCSAAPDPTRCLTSTTPIWDLVIRAEGQIVASLHGRLVEIYGRDSGNCVWDSNVQSESLPFRLRSRSYIRGCSTLLIPL